ncbi:protein of unknown function DUF323 [Gloeothece citriformis PCC 7424]|uniref:Uncharacterized protein n=1 Tax=Gloeothece citriformis (strain PCC 7424) TaxID=65393 RepID=B7KEV4_GLOC7|nr:SUMF1/EgtB/PvdO family nonheme iron enzyme [Gloeothece citriformis]ACK69129.1 protein of unknown function DUF323 [Gloeothece citriformis PCC 7424]
MAKNWALVVGINQYDNLRSLKYAKNDAEAMKAWLENEGGFERVFLFTDNSPDLPASPSPILTKPTYGCLRRFLRAQFEQRLLKTGDNFWFFFAGHGKRYKERDYLMLSDSDPGDVENSALAVNWVTERLRRCGADNVVLFLDACREESSRNGQGIGLDEPQGVITFYGCRPQQQSYEIEQLQHGAFTYALLEALRIRGTDNCATVERLYNHLSYRIPQINQYYNQPDQNPYAVVEPATKYHLILLPQQATVKNAKTLKLDADEQQNQGNYEVAKQLWVRVSAVSPADEDAIKAIKDLATLRLPQLTFPRVRISRRQMMIFGGVAVGTRAIDMGRRIISKFVKNIPNAKTEVRISHTKYRFEVLTVNSKGEEIDRTQKEAEYFTEDLGGGIGLEMVSIPGGTFMMGTEDEEIERLNKRFDTEVFSSERPQHRVTVSAFYMGKYLITQAQWKAVASLPKEKLDLNLDPSRFKGDERPVEQVNWDEAVEFCERLSKKTGRVYRLPSEAQWEYICRATLLIKGGQGGLKTTPFYFGKTITEDLANYNATYLFADEPKGIYRKETTPVGQFPPNAFGLYDLHGNVWEWCLDHWHPNYENAPKDGSAWLDDNNNDYRILRGGSWFINPDLCRSAYRYYIIPRVNRYYDIGFRVVCGFGRT